MSKTTILICAVTVLIVAGLALGTRSETPPTPASVSPTPAADDARAFSSGIPDSGHASALREPLLQQPRHTPDIGPAEPPTLTTATAAAATNLETPRAGSHVAMPWIERDKREVAEEIASNAERSDGPPALPSTSFAELERLYELVPELAEGREAPDTPVDLAELVDEPGLDLPPPGTASLPGAYFEPPEDEED